MKIILFVELFRFQNRHSQRLQRNRRKIYNPHDDPCNRRFVHQTETRKSDTTLERKQRAFSDRSENVHDCEKIHTKNVDEGYYTRFLSSLCFRRNVWSVAGGDQSAQVLGSDRKSCESETGGEEAAGYKVFFVVDKNSLV